MTLTPNETLETENAAEMQPSAQQNMPEQNSGQEDAEHTHEHLHAPQPVMNPELTREIAVEVDADSVSKAFKAVTRKYTKMARIPGFRIGKVPETVIKNRFNKEVRQEVLDNLVAERFRQALTEQNLSPVSQPQLTELNLVDGQPLRFRAAFEVRPEIDINGYDSIEVTKPNTDLTEDEFNAELSRVLDQHATVETVEEDRPAQDGDWTEIEFKGEIQDLAQVVGEEKQVSPDDVITGEDILIEVGGSNTLPAFSDALRGQKVGQEMTFEVTYPQDFGEQRLAGRTVKYDVTLKALKKKTYPEKNDEFAKQLGEDETWAEFESKLREMAAGRKREALEAQARDKMLADLIGRFDFPVPESFVQQQIDARLDRGLRALAQQGMSAEDMRKLDFGRLRAAQRDQAVAEVKASLLLDRIADAEGVQVTEDELERELLIASMQAREPLDTLRNRVQQDGTLDRMRDQMRREKTGNTLFEKLAK